MRTAAAVVDLRDAHIDAATLAVLDAAARDVSAALGHGTGAVDREGGEAGSLQARLHRPLQRAPQQVLQPARVRGPRRRRPGG